MFKKLRKWMILGIGFSLVGGLSACNQEQESQKQIVNENPSHTKDQSDQAQEKLTVVTSFYPLYISTLNVVEGVEGIEVVNMTEPTTGCLHDYILTTRDMKVVETADAFVINGLGLELFLDKIKEQLPELHYIEASTGIELLEGEPHSHAHDEEYHDEEEDHDEEHHDEDEEHEEDHHHDEEEINTHVWVSIANTISQVQNITSQLSELDPENQETYEKNAGQYIEKLTDLKQRMETTLKGVTHRDIVTFHDAFPYFAQEFDLHIVGNIQAEEGQEPNASELAETIDLVKDLDVKVLFAEPQYPAKAAEMISNETGAKLYVLDPASTGEMHPDAYLEIMEKNLEVLEEALN